MINPYYLLTEDQLSLQAMVREFARKELAPVVKECDEQGRFPMEVYRKLCALGINGMYVPEKYGGSNLDLMTICVVREEISKVDTGFCVALGANGLSLMPVKLAGTGAQIQLFSENLMNGGFSSYALTEPVGGSDAGHPLTTAVKKGDEWVINGRKCFVSNGPLASYYVVFAATDKALGARGVTAFIVERDRSGVSVGKHEDKMGIRSSETCDVVFEDVCVPAGNLLGGVNKGFKLAMETLNRTRPLGVSSAVGIMQACIDVCTEYTKTRVVFGKPLSETQAIQFMLADMQMKTIACRQMTYYSARLIDSGIIDPGVGASTKCFVSDSAVEVATNAIQILGGYGYSRDYPVEKYLRDAKIFQIFEGTNQIQRVAISAAMLR